MGYIYTSFPGGDLHQFSGSERIHLHQFWGWGTFTPVPDTVAVEPCCVGTSVCPGDTFYTDVLRSHLGNSPVHMSYTWPVQTNSDIYPLDSKNIRPDPPSTGTFQPDTSYTCIVHIHLDSSQSDITCILIGPFCSGTFQVHSTCNLIGQSCFDMFLWSMDCMRFYPVHSGRIPCCSPGTPSGTLCC